MDSASNDDYEIVEVKSAEAPTYENVVSFEKSDSLQTFEEIEELYTIGRRFPSIRVKRDDKKDQKRDAALSKNQVGSSVMAVTAIYGEIHKQKTLKPPPVQGFGPESNIYENGYIVMKKQAKKKCKCCSLTQSSKYMLAIVLLSVIVFLGTGSTLLYTSREYSKTTLFACPFPDDRFTSILNY